MWPEPSDGRGAGDRLVVIGRPQDRSGFIAAVAG